MPFISPCWLSVCRSIALAMPKSVIFTCPPTSTRMLWGEQSRWTIPSGSPVGAQASCASWSPFAACAMISTAISTGMRSCRSVSSWRMFATETPVTSSITRNKELSSARPRSRVETTFGLEMFAAIRPSSRNIETKRVLSARSGFMRLSATSFWKPASPTARAA